jgi:two-component system KDP operon response regulator KdpE
VLSDTAVQVGQQQEENWLMKILVIDDDASLREALVLSLNVHWNDCCVLAAEDGVTGLQLFQEESPDAVVLDIGLPGMSGFEVLEQIREASAIPVLMLSGREGEADVVRALEMGADTYVTKPCSYLELAARLKAAMRRADPGPAFVPDQVFSVDGLTIHFPSQTVKANNRSVSLTNTEYRLLYHLVRNAGRTVSHRALLRQAWGSEGYGADVVRVYVSRLRTKIEPERHSPRFILTRPGAGYMFAAPSRTQDGATEAEANDTRTKKNGPRLLDNAQRANRPQRSAIKPQRESTRRHAALPASA